MKIEYIILIGVMMLSVGLLLFAFTDFLKNKQDSSANNFRSIVSGTTEQGDVAIEITPQNLDDGKASFLISVNTHSIDLSQFDLKQITFMDYDGNSISPTEAPVLNGHHASGIIIFDTGKKINSFKIEIKGIPKTEDRVFTWD